MYNDRGMAGFQVRMPPESGAIVLKRAQSLDMTMNEYVIRLIAKDLGMQYNDLRPNTYLSRRANGSPNAKGRRKPKPEAADTPPSVETPQTPETT